MKPWLQFLSTARENQRYLKALRVKERELLSSYSWYRALDASLASAYRWRNPFLIARRARRKMKRPDCDLIYGETPILTAWRLLQKTGAHQADQVVELGGGRGVLSLVAGSAFGCSATVLELVPEFVSRGKRICASLGLSRVRFLEADMLDRRLPEGSIYYLTATTLSDESWRDLQRRLAEAPAGARALTLSRPLSDLVWSTSEVWTEEFSWGPNTVYLQVRK